MDQGNEATPHNEAQSVDNAHAQDRGIDAASAANQGNQVDWQKRYTDTQSAFTRSQQELAATNQSVEALKGQLEQITPFYENNKKFFNPDTNQPKSVWERDDGIDGALSERDQVINELKQEMQATRQMVAQTQLKDLADDFIGHQKRLYSEFGGEFGTEADFSEVLKIMPQYDPNWQNSYLQSPTYETLRRSYHTMRGASEYDPSSPITRALEVQKQQAFLKKQSNYLGGGQSIQFGPDNDRPNQPYMTPVEPL